jgi:23S rRNA (cytosine1962-C5)-methyltransferase
MWIADNWKDYEVIDCSKGEKLERWGRFILVRPDPQVIWDTPQTEERWKKKNGAGLYLLPLPDCGKARKRLSG